MLLKKQALTGAYGGFQCCFCSTYATSTSPAVLPIPRARPAGPQNKKRKVAGTSWRGYATVRGSKSYDFRDNMNWPCHTKAQPSSHPSPYDIFELERGAVYSKHKFYELVKIYHPDRHNSVGIDQPIHKLTHFERIERYRLVVQAHEILSDPVKRKAYDATGAGWGAKTSEVSGTSRPWRADSTDSPYANATWEDWERWYAKTNTGPNGPQAYEGTYFNHNAFASFVILVAIITGVLQATHAGTSASSVEERARAFTAQTHQFMNDRRVENAHYYDSDDGHGVRQKPITPVLGPAADERVRHFLQRRDPSRSGLKEEEEEHYRHHFNGQNFPPPPKPVRTIRQTRADDDV
jgi:curved DNA-binding protein CbpA